MPRSATLLRNTLCSLALVSALGFGASQALASPQPAKTGAAACSPSYCNSYCLRNGYAEGYCAGGQCYCYEW
jgi:hypothetical protein